VTLPARQQRTLNRIERRLGDSDPRLLSLFVIFTRLTHEEDMPRLEEVRARLARVSGWMARRTAPIRRRIPHPSDRVKAVLFFPAALATVICALLIGASGPTMQRCTTTIRNPASELVVKARQCRLSLVRVPVPAFSH
jgi:hypothetical protein